MPPTPSRNLIAATLLLLVASSVHAQAYKCTDANGKIQYSDRPCTGVSRSTVTTYGAPPPPPANSASTGSDDGTEGDPLVAKCLEHLRRSREWADRDSLRVEGFRYEWVGVRDVGARRLLHVKVNARAPSGAYEGAKPYQCLIRGDNENIHTGSYELVKLK